MYLQSNEYNHPLINWHFILICQEVGTTFHTHNTLVQKGNLMSVWISASNSLLRGWSTKLCYNYPRSCLLLKPSNQVRVYGSGESVNYENQVCQVNQPAKVHQRLQSSSSNGHFFLLKRVLRLSKMLCGTDVLSKQ